MKVSHAPWTAVEPCDKKCKQLLWQLRFDIVTESSVCRRYFIKRIKHDQTISYNFQLHQLQPSNRGTLYRIVLLLAFLYPSVLAPTRSQLAFQIFRESKAEPLGLVIRELPGEHTSIKIEECR